MTIPLEMPLLTEDEGLEHARGVVAAYYTRTPDPSMTAQRVAFRASGHRGSPLDGSFNEAHVLSISQAICDYRQRQGIHGPLFVAVGTNALSVLAFATTVEVLAANEVEVLVAPNAEGGPAVALSSAILDYNRDRADYRADGIAIAPSDTSLEHDDFSYALPNGTYADSYAARWIDTAANEYLRWGSSSVRRLPYGQALAASATYRAAAEALLRPQKRHQTEEMRNDVKARNRAQRGRSRVLPQGSGRHPQTKRATARKGAVGRGSQVAATEPKGGSTRVCGEAP